MSNRDDFLLSTKRNLAIRAAHFCSHPGCTKLTAGPHSEPDKSLQTGHAAHIHAAAKGGARYLENQTTAERRSAKNGIWMCRECGVLVDNDEKRYPAKLLKRWKVDHEKLISLTRTKGYTESLKLLSLSGGHKAQAKAILDTMADRRSLWEMLDAELPDRVRVSLDVLRDRLYQLRLNVDQGSTLDEILIALNDTIITFFRRVERFDMKTLKCDSGNPNWIEFEDALTALRKSVGYQLFRLSHAFDLAVPTELDGIVPKLPV